MWNGEEMSTPDQPKSVEFQLLLTKEDIEFLLKIREFVDRLLETIEVTSDRELLNELEEALEDVRSGRLTRWEDFLKEVGARGTCW